MTPTPAVLVDEDRRPRSKPDEFYTARPRRRRRNSPIAKAQATIASAIFWLFGCAFIGMTTVIAGVFILAGIGWGIVAIGIAFLLAAVGLQIGIARG